MPATKICDRCDQMERKYDYANRMDLEELLTALRSELHEQRHRFNWSQTELAKRAGLSRSTVSAFEAGDAISLLNFLKITQTLEVAGAWGPWIYAVANPLRKRNSFRRALPNKSTRRKPRPRATPALPYIP